MGGEDFVPTIEEVREDEEDGEDAEGLRTAEGLKETGNELFKGGEYEKSLEKYTAALVACPPSRRKERSVYHCNSAACHVKLKAFHLGRSQCDRALELDEGYVKALVRRILCLEQLDEEREKRRGEQDYLRGNQELARGKPTPEDKQGGVGCATPAAEGKAKAAPGGGEEDLLQLALEDCARWADLEPRSAEASRKKAEIERRIKDRQEKLKEEVMGKLKDLGNNILGRFGLSLDNFKAEKDPETGSYSINFNKK